MAEAIAAALPVLCSAITTLGVWYIQERYKRKDGHREAMRVLMRKELRDIHGEALKAGEISEDKLFDFNEIYKAYHMLGGNGRATIWKTDIERMERKG